MPFFGGKINPKGALKQSLSKVLDLFTTSLKITTIHARLRLEKDIQWKSHVLFYVCNSNYTRFFTSLASSLSF